MAASHDAPPRVLDRPLEISPGDWSGQDFYRVTTGLVIPRPIGWISTVSAAGKRNLAPYSYFNVMGSAPCYVVFASDSVKDTVANLREVPQFVANIVTMHVLEKMHFTSAFFPRAEDEYEWAELTPVAAAKVKPPRVKEARAHLECEVVNIHSDGDTHIVLGKLVHVHVDPSVWKDGRVDARLLDPVCRLQGSAYASLGELYSIPKAEWKDIEGSHGTEKMLPATRKG